MLIALKIDVSTRQGTAVGVPRLRATLERAGAPASFFVPMGPDRSGGTVRRLADRLIGGLWHPMTGLAHGAVLRRVERDGHELALTAWDPVEWREKVAGWSEEEVGTALERGVDAFHEVFGASPRALSAPGGRITHAVLAVQQRLGLDYASDCRGREPFLAGRGGQTFDVLQIPGTLPSVDELVGRDGLTAAGALDLIERSLDPVRLNVYTARAEHEGGWMADDFERFLARLASAGARFVRLCDVAARLAQRAVPLPVCRLVPKQLIGIPGLMPVQGPCERMSVRAAPAALARAA